MWTSNRDHVSSAQRSKAAPGALHLRVARLAITDPAETVVHLRERVVETAKLLVLLLHGDDRVVQRNRVGGILGNELLAARARLLQQALELTAGLLEMLVPLRDDLLLGRIHHRFISLRFERSGADSSGT